MSKVPIWISITVKEGISNLEMLYSNFNQFINCINKNLNFVETTIAMNEIAKVLYPNEKPVNIEKAEKIEANAKFIANEDFSFIYGQWSILLYVNLEAMIKRIIINYLKNTDYYNIEEFQQLKQKLKAYENYNEERKYDLIYKKYENKITNGLNYGFERFESLLKPFGYKINLETKTKNKISELAQVRNIILHKNGIVDSNLIERCDWLDLSYGQKIIVDKNMFNYYFEATTKFTLEFYKEIKIKFE